MRSKKFIHIGIISTICTVFWLDLRMRVSMYASGYAKIRQISVESSAIHSDFIKTLV